MALRKIWLHVNGVDRVMVCDNDKDTLADVLRRIGLTSVKLGCRVGQCGACSIILNGEVIRSCTRKIKNIKDYAVVETIEGLGTASNLHPLQKAWIIHGGVQCGFCTPGFIMSAKGLLDKNPSPAREDVRAWFTSHHNLCRCTGYKPLVDAVMAAAEVMRGEKPADSLDYIMPEDERLLGSKHPKPTALSKVMGLCDYGDDIGMKMPPGTLHLAMVMPELSHAKIKSIDFSEAESMPGVEKVVTAKDVKGSNRVSFPLGHPRGLISGLDHQLFAEDKVFMRGDVLAVVAARTQEEARAAAKAVKVELEPLPAYMNLLDAVAPGAMRIHEECDNMFLAQPVFKGRDTRKVIEESEYAVEGSFYSTREPHAPIEPDVVQAFWDADGYLAIQCKTQFPHGAQMTVAGAVGLPPEKVRVIQNPSGGGFGYPMSAGSFALAGACCMATGKPVTLTMTYPEFMIFTGKRSASYSNGRMACDKDGKITALEFNIAYDHGAYSDEAAGPVIRGITYAGFPYNIPNVMGLTRAGFSNHSFGTAYRGFGSPQAYTCSEALTDMLAEKAGIDPFEFRYINVSRPGDLNNNSTSYKLYPFVEMMDTLRPYYNKAKERADAEGTDERKRGVGVFCGGYCCSGNNDSAKVALELNPDGTITHYNGWSDQGQGADQGSLIHTYEALRPLGIKPEQIRLVMDDTAICPFTGPAAGSRSHYMAGNATFNAAQQLISAMKKQDGTFRTYEEMVAEGIPTKYMGSHTNTGGGPAIDPNTGEGDPTKEFMYVCGVAEVEVETATGKTKVLGITLVADVGVLGSKMAVDGQAYGGTSHCIGFALSEQYEDLKKHVTIGGTGISSCEQVPDNINVIYHNSYRKDGPQGASGCSENFQNGTHMAIINAVYNATGVRIYDLPALPEKILAGLKAKEKGGELKPGPYYLGEDFYDLMDDIKANPVEGKIIFGGGGH